MKLLWTSWFALTALGAGWLFTALPGEGPGISSSTVFLPGETTHGHHQIEMQCAVCHLPDGGVTDQSCIDCHGADLKKARDTHPKTKFNDPTKGPLLLKIDAQNCLSCHMEHQEERTHPMGVTVPEDYCFHCHEDVAKDRPSHEGMAFNTCANAGCHNYHDNTALYENFLKKHSGENGVLDEPANPLRKLQQWLSETDGVSDKQLLADDADAPSEGQSADIQAQWAFSAHAVAGVNCTGCHVSGQSATVSENGAAWTAVPDHQSCQSCHDSEVKGFLMGMHGMRLAVDLPAMTPELARHPMHASAAHKSLNCSACHDAHNPDMNFAAFDSCVSCHDDQHTQNYVNSAHYDLWQSEVKGEAATGTGVSCATCHMPRDEDGLVQHNQNLNLRPNEKMARTVCMNCHGLQFTLDSLADPESKNNCYSTPPPSTVKSLQMVQDWFESKKRK